MNNFFYIGDNPILIKEWNDNINIVILDWLMKNYDSNNQVYCSVLDKFITLMDLNFEQIKSKPVNFTVKRIKSLYGMIDVIEKYPQRTLFGCVKICNDIPNSQIYSLEDLPAYCMGFFFHLGRINKKIWILNCYNYDKFQKIQHILNKKFPQVTFEHRKTKQTTHKGSPIWEISVDQTRNYHNKDFVKKWTYWFFTNNNKIVPKNILNSNNNCKRQFIQGIQDSLESGFESMIFMDKISCAQVHYLHICLGESVIVNQNENDFYSFNILQIPKDLVNNGQIIIEKTNIYLKHPENLYKFEYIPNFKKGELGDRHVLVGIGNMVL